MTKLQKLGVVLLCWPAWILICAVVYAATGEWLMATGDAPVLTAMLTGGALGVLGVFLASGEIK